VIFLRNFRLNIGSLYLSLNRRENPYGQHDKSDECPADKKKEKGNFYIEQVKIETTRRYKNSSQMVPKK
jgi:hypothetical protein